GHLFAFNYGTDFMMKKSLCCALLLTASFSTFAAAKTEQQIAESSFLRGFAEGFAVTESLFCEFMVVLPTG
ncbi:hypothetical protein EYS04_15430, partial [Salmonella enterica subsp. enterica serovar Heidelberg]